jgi:lipopolysaccharide biosynthesis glycosyltransferase
MPNRDVVCLSVDGRMLCPALFVACSVKSAAAGKGRAFDVVIVAPAGDLTAEHRSFARSRGIVLDDSLDAAALSAIHVRQDRFSPANLVRLLLPSHFRDRYRRLIYLDADLTVHGDISVLFDLDMQGHAVAAVPAGRVLLNLPEAERTWIMNHFAELGMTPPYRYFNAGVMVIDPQTWCANRIGARTIAFIKANPELCYLLDEDGLNAVLDGDVLDISPTWNTRPEAFARGKPLPRIMHYAGPNKPWKRFRKFKRLFEHRDAYRLYEEFFRETPWSDWLSSQWTLGDLIGSLRHEVTAAWTRCTSKDPLRDPARRAAYEAELADYKAATRYADIEQKLVQAEQAWPGAKPM